MTKLQEDFVGSSDWILALAYANRSRNANALAITLDDVPIGVVMTSEVALKDEPGFYYIDQFFIDAAHQRCGYGRQAMELAIDALSSEHKFDSIRLDVSKEDVPAVHLYESLGFTQTGYTDPANPELLYLGLKI